MSLTAGTISLVSKSESQIKLAVTAASGGTGPYTNQWYRDTTSGFSPGGGNILTGKTALTLTDVVIPNTTYYYKVVQTDTGHSNDQVTATQLSVTSDLATQSQNQFAQAPFLGMVDLKVGPTNVVAAEIDTSESGTLYAGQAVKIVDSANGIPKVIACTEIDDVVFGWITYDIKDKKYVAGSVCEIAQDGTCIFLYAAGAIARGVQVGINPDVPGSVVAISGGSKIAGFSFDKAAAYGDLIRVVVNAPGYVEA